ncbi:MAG: AAA family ATPase [Methanobacterium sp.]|uniref:AAA family ATPase n=1 Tax=Methanobacterium sp. TaxID=2164 RepID=UPI003C7376E6
MNIRMIEGSYKSIKKGFIWENIPPMVILTGKNGTGKTQLLEAIDIYYNLISGINNQYQFQMQIDGTDITGDEVVFLRDISKIDQLGPISVEQIKQEVTQYQNFVRHGNGRDRFDKSFFAELRVKIPQADINRPDILNYGYYRKITDKDLFLLNPTQYHNQLGKKFLNYYIDFITKVAEGKTPEEAEVQLGEKPWKILNRVLESIGFKYRFIEPVGDDIRGMYNPRLVNCETKDLINLGDLSTGEATIIKIYIWLFAVKEGYKKPRLILLDEPDAFLHPSIIPMFITSIKKGIVEELGARVVMVTHRTETILFMEKDEIIEMHNDVPRIRTSVSKENSIRLLTDNILYVIENKKIVYVEDEDDVEFYNIAKEIAIIDYGINISGVSFIPASLGKNNPKNPGGCSSVIKWVERLEKAGLHILAKGLIDGDNKKTDKDNILQLERYSYENYLLDPINIYCTLLERNIARPIEDPIRAGEESTIRNLNVEQLQSIADAICQKIENTLPNIELEKEKVPIIFGENTLYYPKWLLLKRGHDLMNNAIGIWGFSHKHDLYNSFRKIRMLPDDLLKILRKLV